jgi:hypothetical protein
MNAHESTEHVRGALRRLARGTDVPGVDPRREAELLRAFDARREAQWSRAIAGTWWLTALAGTVALLVAFAAVPGTSGRRVTPPPGDRYDAPGTQATRGARTFPETGEFIAWPGAASLPPLESGELVRTDLPVSLLPSLGVAPPAGHVTTVKADVLVGQDGLTRAVRFVGN